jgi:renalase
MTDGLVHTKVAVVGAGMAGSACARALFDAECSVHVVDKARGPGGRLATRRMQCLDLHGAPRVTEMDHGAPGFGASGAAFHQFVSSVAQAGGVMPWQPTVAAGGRVGALAQPLFVAQPDMPSLCRDLLQGVSSTWLFAVDRLQRGPLGWRLEAAGQALPGHFDAVVLAMPPAQAAPLLAPHRGDWSRRAAAAEMQPCWTLMGVSDRPAKTLPWNVALPEQEPLGWVMRQDARPGRSRAVEEAHWVVHASAEWSRRHLEQPSEWVQQSLQAALQELVGEPIAWQHAVVHRWRYAMPPAQHSRAETCWWDCDLGLGVCGDFLGGAGVEGAWQSARALAVAMQGAASRTAVQVPPLLSRLWA